jgi:hypothetical protein
VVRTPAAEAEARLMAHAAECPACRPIASRYQVLRQAIRAWRQAPGPSADLVQRVLSAPAETTPRPWTTLASERARRLWRDPKKRQRTLLAGFAATAVLGLLSISSLVGRGRDHEQVRGTVPGDVVERDFHSHALPPESAETSLALDRAVAEATAATWDLARSASEPAARIGRDMLDVRRSAGGKPAKQEVETSMTAPDDSAHGLAGLMMPIPSLDPLGSDATTASAVIQEVGGRLSAGVEPISDTARHAFGFLLGPTRSRAESQDRQPSRTGAQRG